VGRVLGGYKVTPRFRVLVAVDNDETLAIMKCLCLRECKLVEVVKDGWAMLRTAGEHSPDLIIADMDMSGLDGIEATARLAGPLREIPVIILASARTHEFVEEAFQAGAAAYVLKDDADQELIPAIHAVMDRVPFVSRSCLS
jgi:two-component system, NarL family, response regulator NreC